MAKGQFAHLAPPHDTEPTTVYHLNGIMYVPHYQQAGRYVGPGYRWYDNERGYGVTHSALELIRAGARQGTHALWPR